MDIQARPRMNLKYFLRIESGIHLSLQTNCHQQIVYAKKYKLKIHFHPSYLQEVWDYKDTNTEVIMRGIEEFN